MASANALGLKPLSCSSCASIRRDSAFRKQRFKPTAIWSSDGKSSMGAVVGMGHFRRSASSEPRGLHSKRSVRGCIRRRYVAGLSTGHLLIEEFRRPTLRCTCGWRRGHCARLSSSRPFGDSPPNVARLQTLAALRRRGAPGTASPAIFCSIVVPRK
jgi:hypothetical protein